MCWLIFLIIIINETQKGNVWLSVDTQTLLMELWGHIRQKRLVDAVCLLDGWLPGHWDDNSGLPAGTICVRVSVNRITTVYLSECVLLFVCPCECVCVCVCVCVCTLLWLSTVRKWHFVIHLDPQRILTSFHSLPKCCLLPFKGTGGRRNRKEKVQNGSL